MSPKLPVLVVYSWLKSFCHNLITCISRFRCKYSIILMTTHQRSLGHSSECSLCSFASGRLHIFRYLVHLSQNHQQLTLSWESIHSLSIKDIHAIIYPVINVTLTCILVSFSIWDLLSGVLTLFSLSLLSSPVYITTPNTHDVFFSLDPLSNNSLAPRGTGLKISH